MLVRTFCALSSKDHRTISVDDPLIGSVADETVVTVFRGEALVLTIAFVVVGLVVPERIPIMTVSYCHFLTFFVAVDTNQILVVVALRVVDLPLWPGFIEWRGRRQMTLVHPVIAVSILSALLSFLVVQWGPIRTAAHSPGPTEVLTTTALLVALA